MNDLTTTIDTHLAGYCEPDPDKRAELLTSVWSADGVLIDPPMDGQGPSGIAALVDVVLNHYPGHRFQRSTAVETHHDYARYGWSMVAPDGEVAVTGTDFARVDAHGKLTQVVGFFGDLAATDA